jgi:uncharacterized surface protein with fasciclin (FAS1) repeats
MFALAILSTTAAQAQSYHSNQQDYTHLTENRSQDDSDNNRNSRSEDERSLNEGKPESYPLPDMSLKQSQSNNNQSNNRYQSSAYYGHQDRDSNQNDYNNSSWRSYQNNDRSINQGQHSNKTNMSVIDIINSNPHFSTFAQALKTSGIIKDLEKEDELTIFVPSNEAFQRVSQQLLRPENKEKLAKILKHHIINDTYQRSDLKTDKIESMDGNNLNIDVRGHRIKINNATIVQTDIEAANGVIHVIDAVLVPDDLNSNQNQSR